ncbi:DUF4397 domain-containing protein [Neiella marina]|uniref:DUF4397 domain-containing protein n=1 Tax=Neiella holothuriorum TaxID=2870530 RepID=A0ABS7ECI9_9GAMM|nr:DUF4397 domain-containing protein [Neiella holothuriorum]MBW8190047.1 DUF4397 domain-containing protein [Neiella holothuriorum]
MKTHKLKLAAVISSAILAASLTGCGGSSNNGVKAVSTDSEYSYLRVYHAAPDAPAVNVWLNGSPALESVDYQVSSGAIIVEAGTHTVQVDAILADGSTLTVIPETELMLDNEVEYNIVATGKAALIGTGDEMEFGAQIVARDALAPEGARVQVMHASPDAPMVDVFITAPGDDLTSAMPFADNVSFTMATDAVEVAAGEYQVRITLPEDPSTVVFDSGTIDVPAGADWFVAAVTNTDAGSSPVNLLVDAESSSLVVRDAAMEADIRVAHTISDAPAVDVWINGSAPAMDSPLYNLSFKEFTDYLMVPAGDYSFAVGVNGSDPVVVVDALSLDATLMAPYSYTAIAIGNLADGMDNDELFVVMDENTRRVATEAKLRAIHASTLAGDVDIYVSADATPSDDDVILTSVPYKGDSTVLSVSPGMAYVMVTPAGDSSTIAIGPAELALEAGTLTTLVAIDDPMSATGVSVISLDD